MLLERKIRSRARSTCPTTTRKTSPRHAAKAALDEITAGKAPKTYDRRRSILEGILDLRMTYYDGDLEIEGKGPVPDAASSSTGGEKKWNRTLAPMPGASVRTAQASRGCGPGCARRRPDPNADQAARSDR